MAARANSRQEGCALKDVSLWQPHASLGGIKPYETRGWPAPKPLIGQRIAIHAAKALVDLIEIGEYMADLKERGGPCNEHMTAFINAVVLLGFKTLGDLPRGAIIGTAILEASQPTATLTNPGPFGDFSPGRFAWRIRDPQALALPVPFRGMHGFFEVPDSID